MQGRTAHAERVAEKLNNTYQEINAHRKSPEDSSSGHATPHNTAAIHSLMRRKRYLEEKISILTQLEEQHMQ